MERSKESKLGYRGTPGLLGFFSEIAARFAGNGSSAAGGLEGSWWRNEVRRCELWI